MADRSCSGGLRRNTCERADALVFRPLPVQRQGSPIGGDSTSTTQEVTDIFLSRNRHPTAGGVAGISVLMELNAEGLLLGLELDAAAGRDRDLLALARRVERVVGPVPGPALTGPTGMRSSMA